MRVHFVIHEAFEAPGLYETWAIDRGYSVTWSRLYEGQPLPGAAEGIDLLVVMGGPQSPATSRAECPHFDAAAECALIAQCIAARKAVVGVCLGAQLIGEALGAAHARSPGKEIGQFPITMTDEGRADPKFAYFPATLAVGHWHSDMPGLTENARVLAFSEGCPRQIVAYGPLVYGFQCHMELARDVVELLIAASGKELAGFAAHRFVQLPDVLRAQDWSGMHQPLCIFLDKLIADYAAQAPVLQ